MLHTEQRAKQRFKTAFLKLVKEIGYSNITVKKLVEESDYNRNSFYRYYNSLDDLSNEITSYMLNIFYDSFEKGYNKYKNSTDLTKKELPKNIIASITYKCMLDNREYFDLLVVEDTLPKLEKNFSDCLFDILENKAIFESSDHKTADNNFFRAYRVYGTVGFLKEWIKNDYQPSYEKLSSYIEKLYSGSFELR